MDAYPTRPMTVACPAKAHSNPYSRPSPTVVDRVWLFCGRTCAAIVTAAASATRLKIIRFIVNRINPRKDTQKNTPRKEECLS